MGEEPNISELQTEAGDDGGSPRRSGWIIAGFGLVIVLILAGLILPPVSLGQRLGLGGDSPNGDQATAGAVATNDEVSLSLDETVDVGVTSLSQSELGESVPEAASAWPAGLTTASPVYVFAYEGEAPQGQFTIAVPESAQPAAALDLFGWQGTTWQFIPSHLSADGQQITSEPGALPRATVLAQSSQPEDPAIGAEASADQPLPVAVLPYLTEVAVGGLTLGTQGQLEGSVTSVPNGPYGQLLHVSNEAVIIDQQSLADLLSSPEAQAAQIESLVDLTSNGGFVGVSLDYQDVPASDRGSFTAFVSSLAEAMHGAGKSLAVTLEPPTLAGNSWDSGGQDWIALGQAVDVVVSEMPLDPMAYEEGGEAQQLLDWATRQVDRRKLNMLLGAAAIDRIGESLRELPNDQALANFGQLQLVQGEGEVEPGETVEVALSGTASPLEWDGASLTYKYNYDLEGQSHNVWLGNEAALSQRAQLAGAYRLRGITVRGLDQVANGEGYSQALYAFKEAADGPQPTGAAIVWTVRDGDDSVVASASGNDLSFTWVPDETAGAYTIEVDFALGDNVANLGALNIAVVEAASEEVAEAAAETETEAPVAGTETPAEPDSDTPAPPATFDPGDADAVVNVTANVRVGPGLTYGTVSGGAQAGDKVQLIGRSEDSSWLQVILADGETEGWIFTQLLTVNSAFGVSALEVVEVEPPVIVAGGDGTAAGSTAGTAPPPVSAPAVTNAGFELGGQTQAFANPTLMSYAGMNWVKFQHKWNPGESPEGLAGRIQQAHGSGFKVLLSIPGGSSYPSSIDFASYVDFLGGVAALGPDAIEVWNEMNIDFEWPAGQIDPTSYVNNMLAPAYNRIKSANSSVMVISGAPAPTGFFSGGCSANGCDDSAYLAGMAAAGAANYMDCMGAHSNAGATSPYQTTGHPAGNDHYSWHLMPTLDLYANALGKPVCFTELGYLSGEDFGGVPSRFSWAAGTSVAEHAQWLAEAVSLAAASGRVRLAIIFNVDFTLYGEDPQAGYAIIRPSGGCPACETLRQTMGR